MVGPDGGERIVLDSHHVPLVALVHLADESRDQEGDVFHALAERRELEGKDVQAIVEVLAELSLLEGLRRIAVGGRQHADVHLNLLGSSEPPETTLFENPQELRLGRRRHLRHLVEEECPASRELEEPLPPSLGAGESTPLVPEDLAFEKRFGYRGAVHADEPRLLSRRELVQGAGHQLLPGSRLSHDQDRCRRRPDLRHQLVELHHRRARPHHAAERAGLAKVLAVTLGEREGGASRERPVEHLAQLLGVDGLREVVEGALLHRLDRGGDAAFRGQHDHGEMVEVLLEAGE